jgi:hypothetical protein
MDKKWFLECLADPWIFNSVREFQYDVQSGGIIEYDCCGNLLFINKETLQLEEGDDCFRDGLDIWKIAENEDRFGVPTETIERIIKHFSDDKRQLIGVLRYDK